MNQINYEVRDDWGNVAGWFSIKPDARSFIDGLNLINDAGYTIHEVNKLVKEND